MKQYIDEIKKLPDGSAVKGKFAVRSKEAVRDYKSKEGKFFSLDLSDRSGSMPMKYWGGPNSRHVLELYASISPGDVVMLTGTVSVDKYEGMQVITVNEGTNLLKRVESVPPEELGEYLPSTKRDIGAMMAELDRHVDSMGNQHLKALLKAFLGDKELRQRYSTSPSAIIHHHNFIGGNLEHSLGVLRVCMTLCDSYPELDRDLMTAGAILHDVGKLVEYSAKASITMTDEGRFLGHVTIGERMVNEKAAGIPGFPPELLMKLGHVILQHHGSWDDNIHKGMKIPEAAALHLADEADSQTKEFLQAVENARESQDAWVYIRAIGNEVYTK